MAAREFTTSAAAVGDDAEIAKPIVVSIDGREYAFNGATEGQISLLLAGTSESSTRIEGIANSINFFFSMLEDDDDRRTLKHRMLDSKDPFGAVQVMEVIQYLVEEWSGGRPTKQPSDFEPSHKPTGPRSTAPLPPQE